MALPLTATAEARLPGGSLLTEGGQPLPLLHSEAQIHITGDIATVRVTQTFKNPSSQAHSAHYLFPLPHDSAVHAMTMRVGDEVVRARIEEVSAAKKTFAAAKAQGKTAALLEQHRANVFTQDVAHIPGAGEVVIEIHYAQPVPREEGAYNLHFPMVVASRYDNHAAGATDAKLKAPPKGLLHKDDARATGTTNTQPRVRVSVKLDTGLPITTLSSPSHELEVNRPAPAKAEVLLAAGEVVDDRDFVLRYTLAGEDVQAGLLQHTDPRGSYFSVLVEPPAEVAEAQVQARELVFVIDASCSMAGAPLDLSRRLMRNMLHQVRPEDRFRLIVFGSSTAELSRGAVAPTAENLARADAFLSNLRTMGGTEIELGIQAALSPEADPERLRLVVFLTDGFIGDELSVMRTIEAHRGAARIFSFGVGDSVNRWLLEEMAVAGHGVATIVGLSDDGEQVVDALTARLRSPFVTDAWVDFGGCEVSQVSPAGTFDLYAGRAVRLLGRAPATPCKTQPILRGQVGGEARRWPLKVVRLEGPQAEAIPILWARAQVADRMRSLARPLRGPAPLAERDQLVREITQLGLDYGISTRWTAFVAVAQRTTTEGPSPEADIPLGQPHGVNSPAGHSFGGSSTPEPAEWAAMLMLAMMAAMVLLRQRRA